MFEEPGKGWSLPSPTRRVRMQGDENPPASPKPSLLSGGNPSTLNTSTNVMMLYRLHNLQHMSMANFTMAVMSLLYAAVNVVLLIFNVGNHNDDDCGDPDDDPRVPRCGSTIGEEQFHRLEFWAAFCFALITAFSLQFTPKAVSHIYSNPIVLKLVLLFQIVLALIPSILVTANMEVYETLSHEIEYINELTIAFVDLILLASLVRVEDEDDGEYEDGSYDLERHASSAGSPRKMASSFKDDRSSCNSLPIAACVIAGLQIVIYNSGRWIEGAEKLAHYFEFSFGIISAFVTFWFCMDNRFEADNEIMEILYGTHRDCINCTRQCIELQGYHRGMHNSMRRRRPSIAHTLRKKLARSFSNATEGVSLARGDKRFPSVDEDSENEDHASAELVPKTSLIDKKNRRRLSGGYDACCSNEQLDQLT